MEYIPVKNLDKATFNQHPVGTGHYRFVSINPFDDFVEVTVERFNDYYGIAPNIDTIQLKIFSNYKNLLKHQNEIDAIRNVPYEYIEKTLSSGKFKLIRYHLPQYVALFINTQSPKLKETLTRIGLQLGTD